MGELIVMGLIVIVLTVLAIKRDAIGLKMYKTLYKVPKSFPIIIARVRGGMVEVKDGDEVVFRREYEKEDVDRSRRQAISFLKSYLEEHPEKWPQVQSALKVLTKDKK